jgi:8-oxo-dGTP diphosphatase
MKVVRTRILPKESIDEGKLTYVVIGTREGDNWIFVRHRDRISWEMPAGHIEPGETADQAAVRELYEETGTVDSSLNYLCDYEVQVNNNTEYGRLYGAYVVSREDLPEYEIGEIRFDKKLPDNLTYPEVQKVLFKKLELMLR